MSSLLIALALAYLLGSISGSLVLGRFIGIDIRGSGSGNAGGTNALRSRGWRFALAVVLIDIGKGVLAAALAGWLWVAQSPLSAVELAGACTLMAAIGHTWPVFFGFRGGKGAGTLIGGLCVTWPLSVLPVFLVWVTSLVLSGYVGLSTVLAAAVLVPLALLWAPIQVPFAIAAALFIAFTHRGNLRRLRAGTEHRFERVRIFRRRQTPAA